MNFISEESNVLQNIDTQEISRTFISKVFLWMTGALALSAITAFLITANFELFIPYMFNQETGKASMLLWITVFAPLILVFIMSSALNRLSLRTLSMLYILYSILMGVSLSVILLAYNINVIAITFAVTAGTFGIMALMGYTTKTDLTKFGSLLLMALFGMIIAMLVNWFVKSDSLSYIISIIGVLVFTGLTAYDVQKLKRFSAQINEFDSTAGKMALMGALTLYLDFINLFLFLLRIFGRRK